MTSPPPPSSSYTPGFYDVKGSIYFYLERPVLIQYMTYLEMKKFVFCLTIELILLNTLSDVRALKCLNHNNQKMAALFSQIILMGD